MKYYTVVLPCNVMLEVPPPKDFGILVLQMQLQMWPDGLLEQTTQPICLVDICNTAMSYQCLNNVLHMFMY